MEECFKEYSNTKITRCGSKSKDKRKSKSISEKLIVKS